MTEKKRREWLGGYVRKGKKGSVFIIERRIGDVRIHVSTRCRTERAALEQLARFEADPFHYSPSESGAVTITPKLVEEYGEWMRDVKRNSPEWISWCCTMLGDWLEDLGGKDLRKLNVQRDLKPALAKRGSRKHRIEALKSFCGWLRREKGLLTLAEDRTVDLPVPQSSAAKTRRRRVVAQPYLELVLAKLKQGKAGHRPDAKRRPSPPSTMPVTHDVMLLQSGTAWHISEVRRFAEGGEIVRPHNGKPLAVLVTLHKSGELTRTPINDPEHLQAAERLRARGRIPIPETIVDHLKWACAAVREDQERDGVPEEQRLPKVRLGVMRHSVLNRAVELGASPEQAAQFANHRSAATTKKFYLDVAAPTVTIPTMRLVKG